MSQTCPICGIDANNVIDSDVEVIIEVDGHDQKYLVCKTTLHFIDYHDYCPRPDFMDSVRLGTLVEAIKVRTNGREGSEVYLKWYLAKGYLPVGFSFADDRGDVQAEFVAKLKKIMEESETGDGEN